MRNLEFPIHQSLFEEASALYAVRYSDVAERMASDDPSVSFTNFVHSEMSDVEAHGSMDDAFATAFISRKLANPHLGKTLAEINDIEGMVDPDMEMPSHVRELKVIDFMSDRYDTAHGVEQIQWLGVLGIMAGCNKPTPADAEMVVKQRVKGEPGEHEVFRRAVRRLRHYGLESGEKESIEANHKIFLSRINQAGKDAERAATVINRYNQGIFVGKLLGRLMNPSLRRAHVIDEIDFVRGLVAKPRHIPPASGYTTPIIRLPWPILAKTRKAEGPRTRTTGSVAQAIEEKTNVETIALTHQIMWIDDLAETWEHGGQRTRVDELPSGNRKRPYRGALLNNRYGEAVVHVADTEEPENALYYAAADNLRDPDTGEPVPILEAFRGNKQDARARGAKHIDHVGQNFYKDLMDRVREDVARSEQRPAMPETRD